MNTKFLEYRNRLMLTFIEQLLSILGIVPDISYSPYPRRSHTLSRRINMLSNL